MQTDLIVVSDYCNRCDVETSFIILLAEEGLIDIEYIEGEEYLPASQLADLERYIRWYYDLSINIAGIDAIQHLLKRMDDMQKEIRQLKQQLAVSIT